MLWKIVLDYNLKKRKDWFICPKGIDNKKKAEVVADYALTNSYNATAKKLGISDKTVKKIVEDNPKLYEEKKDEFVEKSSKLIDKALKKLDKALDKDDIPVNNLTTVIGTLYDKRALARGESTGNNKFDVNIKVVE